MLQKILVVLVGIVMSIVGALSPSGLFASAPSVDVAPVDGLSSARDAVVATVRTTDGASAKVSVLWVEVDGRLVTDDAWGTGSVDELRFKVGVKEVSNLALTVGDRLVPLNPTDVLTVRMFAGEFSFRDMGTSAASLQLKGSVKTALVNEGASGSRVRTEMSGAPDVVEAPAGGTREVAYVVLTTGERLNTVAVADGGSRLFTEEASSGDAAKNVPGNLLAKWVKIDGKLVQEYTWGDGVLGAVEFEPADGGLGGVVVAYNDAPSEVAAGSRVLVKDFVGEYLVYQVAGGMLRLQLDGYAADMTVGAASSSPVQAGQGAPIAAFEYAPSNPKTTDTIRFTDKSSDDTSVALRSWRFGDDGTSVLPNPTHRFLAPGQYVVSLTVTDVDRMSSETSVVITVANAPPVPDFDFWPKTVTTDTIVSFTDDSIDSDGTIVSRSWDFGDGDSSADRNPTHSFNASGAVTVTLTTTDNLGGSQSISKIIEVRNTPPLARFTYSPTEVMTLVPIQFQDNSVDKDGSVVKREWTFGDGENASGTAPVHIFRRAGLYTVSLTATDNSGDSDTTSTQIFVRNRLPIVNFTWTPQGSPADKPVHFTSLANDPDGTVLIHEWDFGDGNNALEQNPTHFFQRSGIYNVTLTVTDNMLERNSSTIQVAIANAMPRVSINIAPNPAFRGVDVTFADVSTDPDGDAIVNRTWVLDGGMPVYDVQLLRRTFNSSGDHSVLLTVRDAAGSVGSATASIKVVNRPPLLENVTVTPDFAVVDQPVTFSVIGADLDVQPGDAPLTYEWTFSDGAVLPGQSVQRIFTAPGRITATVRATDSEGAKSNPLTTVVSVDFALPLVNFVWQPGAPNIPATGESVRFESTSLSLNGPITSWRWDFKDGTTADGPIVNHTFTRGDTYLVRLTATDNRSRSASIELPVVVNGRPIANFDVSPVGIVARNTPVTFTDLTRDTDNDAIVAWHWNFGDGVSNEQNPVHSFTTPGRHDVVLTSTDARGASATVTKIVRVQNERPHARFAAPAGLVAGEEGEFTDTSTDPEGSPIVAWTWNFGDAGSSTAQHPKHTFAQSGRYTVSLQVSDGELTSPSETGSFQLVRVGANHAVTIDVRGLLPDGRSADLSDPAYIVRASVGQPQGGFTPIPVFAPNGSALSFTLDRGTWMRGDLVVVTLQAPAYFSGTVQYPYPLTDADGATRTAAIELQIPMPLVIDLTVEPGTQDTLMDIPVLVPNDEQTLEGDPVYRSMLEPFHGFGQVRTKDGFSVRGASVILEARYLPVRNLGSLRDALGLTDSNLLGWCRAGAESSETSGNFTWTLDPNSDCTFEEVGLHPVGRWEVRARASLTFAESVVSQVRNVYVDPTGGFLWSAAAPP